VKCLERVALPQGQGFPLSTIGRALVQIFQQPFLVSRLSLATRLNGPNDTTSLVRAGVIMAFSFVARPSRRIIGEELRPRLLKRAPVLQTRIASRIVYELSDAEVAHVYRKSGNGALVAIAGEPGLRNC
jgi:hypothetical protein